MIDSSTGQNSNVDTATANWFDSIQSPTPEPPKKPRNIWLIAGGILVFLAIAGTAAALLTNQGSTCLNSNDYRTLTGTDSNDLSPTDDFFTDYVLFKTGSNDYDNSSDSGEHGQQLMQNIADFYASVSTKSVIITIRGNYFTADASKQAQVRIDTVKSSLISSGIPEKVIAINTPVYIAPENPTSQDSETIIAITSSSACK